MTTSPSCKTPSGNRCPRIISINPTFVAQNENRTSALAPVFGPRQVAGAEHEQRQGQHAVHAHEGCVTVIRREKRADLVVADDRHIDQETEDTRAEEIPEPDRGQEHHRPAVRERRAPATCCRLPSWRNDQASTVSNVSGMTSAAEKNAPRAISTAGPPLK